MGSSQRVGISERNLAEAYALRSDLSRERDAFRNGWRLQQIARQLENGFKFFIKYGTGQNLSRAFEVQLRGILESAGLSVEVACELAEEAARFCLANENKQDNSYPKRLEGACIDLSELARLGRQGGKLSLLLDEFIRFKAVQRELRKSTETVMFEGVPLAPLTGNTVDLMLRVRAAGYKIEEVEGAIAFWKDGTLTVRADNNVVQLTDLMRAFQELMG